MSKDAINKSRKLSISGKVSGLCLTCSIQQWITRGPWDLTTAPRKSPLTEALWEQSLPGKADEVPTICSVALLSFGQEHFLGVNGKRNMEKGTSALVLQNRTQGKMPVLWCQWSRSIQPPTAKTIGSFWWKAEQVFTTFPCITKANKIHSCSVQQPKYIKKQCLQI